MLTFGGASKRNHAFNWSLWRNLQIFSDDDPYNGGKGGYSLKKLSNTEAKVIKYNYEPFYRSFNGRDHSYTMSGVEK